MALPPGDLIAAEPPAAEDIQAVPVPSGAGSLR